VSYSGSGEPSERAVAQERARLADPAANPSAGDAAAETSAETAERRGEIPRTKTAAAHNGLIAGAIVLILLLVFILENTQDVRIAYFGVGFHMPLGVALLLAAIAGALIVGIVGSARILQLRRRVRHPR
jgi:uncharacterized integral membrane protein